MKRINNFAVGLLLAATAMYDRALFALASALGLVFGAAPMRDTDFRSVVEPILNKVFDGIYDVNANEYKQVFKEEDGIPRKYHEEPVLYGMGAAPELPDGMPVEYQQGGTLYIQRFVYKVFGMAYAMTQTLIEDGDHVRLGKVYAEHLARSMMETRETKCANNLNYAFNGSFTGGDGVALCVNNHPLAYGFTASNLLNTSAALSQTSVEQMLIQIRSAVDSANKKIRLSPMKLVVSPSNQFQAEVITKSVLRSATANNDINPVRSMGLLAKDTAVLSRLTSPNAWWVQNDVPRGLLVMRRRALKRSMEGDFETDSIRYKATERYETGWVDWRCVFGTPGT